MPQEIVDLDVLVPRDLKVRLDGVVYALPPDLPVPDFIELEQLMRDVAEAEDTEPLQALYEKVFEIFRIKNPGLEELPLGPKRLGAAVLALYGGGEELERPTRAPARSSRAGTRSTKPRAARRSASSKSSRR